MSKEKVVHPDLERLAELCHSQWSGWMEYLFSKCEEAEAFDVDLEGYILLPAWAVERWQRQMTTPYTDLPEEEKEADRIEAQKIIDLLNS